MFLRDARECEDVIRRGRLVGSITSATDSPSALKRCRQIWREREREREKKNVVIFPLRPLEALHTLTHCMGHMTNGNCLTFLFPVTRDQVDIVQSDGSDCARI